MKSNVPKPRIERFKASIRVLLSQRDRSGAVHSKPVAPSTRTSRYRRCMRIADDLYRAGYHLTRIRRLRRKHVRALVSLWSELKPGYRDGLRSALRFICRAIGKAQFIREI